MRNKWNRYCLENQQHLDVDLFHGRIDVARIQAFINKGLIAPDQCDGVYLCGPSQMTLSIAEFFKEQGMDGSKVHTELFEVAGEERH